MKQNSSSILFLLFQHTRSALALTFIQWLTFREFYELYIVHLSYLSVYTFTVYFYGTFILVTETIKSYIRRNAE